MTEGSDFSKETGAVLAYGDAVGDYVVACVPDAGMLLAETLVAATVELLGECTPEQLALFDRVQPDYPSTTSVVKLSAAYELARRTVLKNRERQEDAERQRAEARALPGAPVYSDGAYE